MQRVMYILPEVFSHDGVQFLSHCAVDGGLRSLLRCFQEYGEQREHQRHHRRVTHQIGHHCPRVHRVHRHIQPWGGWSQHLVWSNNKNKKTHCCRLHSDWSALTVAPLQVTALY